MKAESISALPLVSILMTAYNREQFIAEAIESVLSSTYQNWELILVDDGSKDGTVAIAKKYAAKDERIKVYVNEKNLGDYPNRNYAASLANGKYIAYLDSDDWMFKQSLEQWVTIMEKEKKSFGIFAHSSYTEVTIVNQPDTVREHFFKQPLLTFGPGATIISTTYFFSIGGFPVKYGPANDMYYNLKVASSADTVVFPFPLNDYRIHSGQELNNKYSYLYNNYLYLRDALSEINLSLTLEEKKYLQHKNNRRFISNVIRYFFKTKNLQKTIVAIKTARFDIGDFADGFIGRRI